jgi:hypothetical protein
LFYIYALETNDTAAPIGIWSGEYDATFTIDGTSRQYTAGADGMKVDDIIFEKGTTIRRQSITLNGVNATALEMVNGRIIRGQKAELHLMFLHPITGDIVGYNRVFRGFVNKAPSSIGKKGDASTIDLELVSGLRTLTKPLPLKKSEHAQKTRAGTDDHFRNFSSVAAETKVEWGPGKKP